MTAYEQVPYSWLKSIDRSLLSLDQQHPAGALPPFPLDSFQEAFAKGLGIDPFSLNVKSVQWKSETEVASDFGNDLFSQEVCFEECESPIWLLLARSSLETLILLLSGNEEPSGIELFDEEILQGFERFLLLRALKALKDSEFIPSLCPHLGEENRLPKEPCMAISVEILAKEQPLSIRLLLPEVFIRFLKEKSQGSSLSSSLSKETIAKIKLPIHVEIGKAAISKELLQELEIGDILLLDLCSYDPESQKGFATLTLHGHPKAKASFEQGLLKISEEPAYEEAVDTLKRRIFS